MVRSRTKSDWIGFIWFEKFMIRLGLDLKFFLSKMVRSGPGLEKLWFGPKNWDQANMFLFDLPNIVLVKIFKVVGPYETVRLFYKYRLKHMKPVLSDPSIWSYIHLSNSSLLSINYEIFDYFCQLLILNQYYIPTLIIDNDLDDVCRQLLYNNGFDLLNFRSLKRLIIDNKQILFKERHCLFNKCTSTLETLKLNKNCINDKCGLRKFQNLTHLQLTVFININQQSFQHLIELDIKIIFDYSSRDLFTRS
ncbi:unnamed protein product [Didymodactylos carnosus]|uniref:F-box domain-containing protein n=1 Tax=Didymodactylos carnosus TaxID=1234261 RepID=A0A813X5W6_9BILA|nr:unnamed protein product [Didymodactylos carnosus]CAF3649810.1 unnamed protein product [Didymodactylos carnosus]